MRSAKAERNPKMGGCPHAFFSSLLVSLVLAELLRDLSGVNYDADNANSSVMVGKSQLLITPNKMVVMPLNRERDVTVLREPTLYGTIGNQLSMVQ
jgi:hypothetical protein